MSKIFEKLLLKRPWPVIEEKNIIAVINLASNKNIFEEKQICSAVFLDMTKSLDSLPKQDVEILSSYIKDRIVRIRQEDEYAELKEINAGVPQGSVLGVYPLPSIYN